MAVLATSVLPNVAGLQAPHILLLSRVFQDGPIRLEEGEHSQEVVNNNSSFFPYLQLITWPQQPQGKLGNGGLILISHVPSLKAEILLT